MYYGGYADVWKGELGGRHVAVKVLRVRSTDNFGKIMSVGLQVLLENRHGWLTHNCRDSTRKLSLGSLFNIQTYYDCWEW